MVLVGKSNSRFARNASGTSHYWDQDYFDGKGAVQESYNNLWLSNTDYKATLEKAKLKDGQWLLSEFDMKPAEENRKVNGLEVPWLSLFNGGVSVFDWVRKPEFVMLRSERLPSGSTLRIHFESKLPLDIKTGYLDVDPLHFYRIIGYSCHQSTKQTEEDRKGTLEYESDEGIPILKVMTEETPVIKLKDGQILSARAITTYTVKYNGPVSDDEFRLSYYGLPEPGGPAKKRTPWYVWILCGAAGCAFLAVGFRYLRRRSVA